VTATGLPGVRSDFTYTGDRASADCMHSRDREIIPIEIATTPILSWMHGITLDKPSVLTSRSPRGYPSMVFVKRLARIGKRTRSGPPSARWHTGNHMFFVSSTNK
jgi:hypothetical protein